MVPPAPCSPVPQYCLRAGQYSLTVPDDLASMPGEPCQKVDSITCIRRAQRTGRGGGWGYALSCLLVGLHTSLAHVSDVYPLHAGTARQSSLH